MLYHNQTTKYVLKEFNTTERGLSKTDASERLRQHGPNTIIVKGDPLWRKIVEPFADIFMLVLFVAALISVIEGATLDAIIILAIMAVSATIYYVQRFSTERILRSLQKKSRQRIEVLRDQKTVLVDATKLVPGDIILLSEGEKIPADARIIDEQGLRVNESSLTGESEPMEKNEQTVKGQKEIYERTNMLYQGSFVISGTASAVVVATGNSTEFGQLAALSKKEETLSPVQVKINRLVKQIIIAVGAISVVAFLLALRNGVEFSEAIRFVMALAVSAVPESLPIAISVVLVLGMRRMAAKKALVRNMRAIETVGALTTIATDKTGTLTKNKLTVQEIWRAPTASRGSFARQVQLSVNLSGKTVHDPLDIAMSDYAKAESVKVAGNPIVSLPFDQETALSGNIWHSGGEYSLHVKGAPEQLIAHSDLTDNEVEEATNTLHALTSQGYRVIAVASTTINRPIEEMSELPKRTRFDLEGFIAVADALRPEAKRAINSALKAGVTVRMITGDHFETAYHIGRQLGMVNHRNQVFDSRRLSMMSDAELSKVIDDIRVFSRVVPENKHRILTLLKKHNITAMTGDGVNDVPALSNAHVGVAMGSGSSIAKDAGDIILLDDNFKTIIDAMREGRTIIGNIRRMLYYLLSTNAGEALTFIGALILGVPVPLAPVQILWINLVTDTAMVIPLGLEPGEKDVMKRRPERPNAPILSRTMIIRMVLIALSMAAVTLTFYMMFLGQHDHAYASTIAFCALVVMQWANAFNARSDFQSVFTRLKSFNGKFYIGLTVAVFMQILAIFGPLQGLLHIEPVAIADLVTTGAIAFAVPIIIAEIHKYFGRRKIRTQQA